MIHGTPIQVANHAAPIALSMPPDSFYDDMNLEPSMIRVRASNSATITLTSNAALDRSKPPNIVQVANPSNSILLQRAKRVSVSSVFFRHNTPTINQTNDTVLCYDQSANRIYPFVLKHGNYLTPQQLIKTLDNAIIASGIATTFFFYFRGTPVPAYVSSSEPTQDSEVLCITTTPVYFLSTSSAIAYGRSTYGWSSPEGPAWDGVNPVNATLAARYQALAFTEQLIGPMPCTYTRYVDVYSSSLSRWTKNPSTTTNSSNGALLFRYYFPVFVGYDTDPGTLTTASAIIYQRDVENGPEPAFNPTYFTVNPSEAVTTIDLTFRDEYGNLFEPEPQRYSRTAGINPATRSASDTINIQQQVNTGGIWWNIVLYTEV